MITVMLEKKSFLPQQSVKGTVTWHLDKAPKDIVVRLFWYTQGRGTEDLDVVDQMSAEASTQGQMSFNLTLPQGPYTFSGKLISVIWAVECVVKPTNECAREELVFSPTGKEIILKGPYDNSTE